MKIAVLNWPINNIGGIATWAIQFREAGRALGHTVDTIHLSENARMAVDSHKDRLTKNNIILAGIFRGISTPGRIHRLKAELASYDMILILHPSPHPTNSQVSKMEGGRRWQIVYEMLSEMNVPYTVMFHDNNWRKTNWWFAEVANCVPKILGGQKLFAESAKTLPGDRKIDWVYHPLKIPANITPLAVRPDIGIMHSQWLHWKRHKEFLAWLKDVEHPAVFWHLYHAGLKYHYLKLDEDFQEIVDDLVRHTQATRPLAEYRGLVPHEQVMRNLGHALCSLDNSVRGYVNYTHWEPLACGAYSILHASVFNHPCSVLPSSPMVVVLEEDEDLTDSLSSLRERRYHDGEAQSEAVEFCRKHLSAASVFLRVVEFTMER